MTEAVHRIMHGREIFKSEEEKRAALEAREQFRARLRSAGFILNRGQMKDVGRNEPCPCGSGKKFKKCHIPR